METFEAKGKQVWIKFENKGGGGYYPVANCHTDELAIRIASALNNAKDNVPKT